MRTSVLTRTGTAVLVGLVAVSTLTVAPTARAADSLTIDSVACTEAGQAATVSASANGDPGETLKVWVDGNFLGASSPAMGMGDPLTVSLPYTTGASPASYSIHAAVVDGADAELISSDSSFVTGGPGSCGGGGGGGGGGATVPDQPGAPFAVPADSQAALSWTPAGDGGDPITDYVVEYNDGSGWTVFNDGVSSTPSASVTGLTNGTSYVFHVAAVNSQGTGLFSVDSNSVTPSNGGGGGATVPDQVAGVTATGGNAQATLSWSAPADGGDPITDYVVEYNDGSGWTAFNDGTSATTGATVTGLTNGTSYVFHVAAVNSQGTGAYSADSNSVTPTAPAAGPASKLALTAPATATAGTPFSVSVEVQDASGVRTASTATVTLQTTPAGLQGVTTVAAVNGIASFTGLELNSGGVYTLRATSGVLTDATTTVTVTAPPLTCVPGFRIEGSQCVAIPKPAGTLETTGTGPITLTWGLTGGDPDYWKATSGSLYFMGGCTDMASAQVNPSGSRVLRVDCLEPGTSRTVDAYFTPWFGDTSGDQVHKAFTLTRAATVPGKPGAPSVTLDGHTATVTWVAPASDGGSPITSYRLLVDNETAVVLPVSNALTTQVAFGAIGKHTVQVVAANALGDSPASEAATVTVEQMVKIASAIGCPVDGAFGICVTGTSFGFEAGRLVRLAGLPRSGGKIAADGSWTIQAETPDRKERTTRAVVDSLKWPDYVDAKSAEVKVTPRGKPAFGLRASADGRTATITWRDLVDDGLDVTRGYRVVVTKKGDTSIQSDTIPANRYTPTSTTVVLNNWDQVYEVTVTTTVDGEEYTSAPVDVRAVPAGTLTVTSATPNSETGNIEVTGTSTGLEDRELVRVRWTDNDNRAGSLLTRVDSNGDWSATLRSPRTIVLVWATSPGAAKESTKVIVPGGHDLKAAPRTGGKIVVSWSKYEAQDWTVRCTSPGLPTLSKTASGQATLTGAQTGATYTCKLFNREDEAIDVVTVTMPDLPAPDSLSLNYAETALVAVWHNPGDLPEGTLARVTWTPEGDDNPIYSHTFPMYRGPYGGTQTHPIPHAYATSKGTVTVHYFLTDGDTVVSGAPARQEADMTPVSAPTNIMWDALGATATWQYPGDAAVVSSYVVHFLDPDANECIGSPVSAKTSPAVLLGGADAACQERGLGTITVTAVGVNGTRSTSTYAVGAATSDARPSRPTDVLMTFTSGRSFGISWTAPVFTDALTYLVEVRPSDGPTTWVQAGVTSDASTTLTGLEGSTTYLVRVTAVTADGVQSDPSDELTVKTTASVPSAPVQVQVVAVGSSTSGGKQKYKATWAQADDGGSPVTTTLFRWTNRGTNASKKYFVAATATSETFTTAAGEDDVVCVRVRLLNDFGRGVPGWACTDGTSGGGADSGDETGDEWTSADSTSTPAEKMVTICHVSGRKYQKMDVELSTLEGHLGHGDYQLDTEDPDYPNCAARA